MWATAVRWSGPWRCMRKRLAFAASLVLALSLPAAVKSFCRPRLASPRFSRSALMPAAREAEVLAFAEVLKKEGPGGEQERILDVLGQLESLDMTYAVLVATNVGKWVGRMRKHQVAAVAAKAKTLVTAWKQVAASQGAQTVVANPFSKAAAGAKKTAMFPAALFEEEGGPLVQCMAAQGPLELPAYPADVYYNEKGKVKASRRREWQRSRKDSGPVAYWMQRDQRVRDNYALLEAQKQALKRDAPLCVVFNLVPSFMGAGVRQFGFMLRGLRQVEADLRALNIPFVLLMGDPTETVPAFAEEHGLSLVVTDFSPLKISQEWKKGVSEKLGDGVGFSEVDAHNVCPAWEASDKQEFSARTLRTKLHRAMEEFVEEFPPAVAHPHAWPEGGAPLPAAVDWRAALGSLSLDWDVHEVDWCLPGERRALEALRGFLGSRRFAKYDSDRNDATLRLGTSNLSPYLHFGQISAQRVVLEVGRAAGVGIRGLFPKERSTSWASLCEELVIRRELSDNFCLFAPNYNYDKFEGCHAWAQKTLNEHRGDPRDTMYSLKQLEEAKTADTLWNAAQLEMVSRGKMAGYMRMLWAKNIQLWTESPEQAIEFALHLNDKYSIDGRDPNGICGVMWAICGVHDRAWQETPIRGKVRPMTSSACQRKFNVRRYIDMNPRTFAQARSQNRLNPKSTDAA